MPVPFFAIARSALEREEREDPLHSGALVCSRRELETVHLDPLCYLGTNSHKSVPEHFCYKPNTGITFPDSPGLSAASWMNVNDLTVSGLTNSLSLSLSLSALPAVFRNVIDFTFFSEVSRYSLYPWCSWYSLYPALYPALSAASWYSLRLMYENDLPFSVPCASISSCRLSDFWFAALMQGLDQERATSE
jgi:hypothetical protein